MSDVDVLAVNWWCQATRAPWTWTPKLYVGVWLMMARHPRHLRLGDAPPGQGRRASTPATSGRSCGSCSAPWALWLATDWPLGLLGSGYLLSIHTTLYLIYTMVAAPLMLIGIPDWMARNMLDRLRGWGAYRWW